MEDQQAWKIPPCISNWKNARGFIIPLDKRLAADGRGLQEVTINDKFAMLTESLYIAERKAVEDLNVRNELRKKIALREKEEREEALRDMANKARLERAGLARSEGGVAARRDSFDESDAEDEAKGENDRRKAAERAERFKDNGKNNAERDFDSEVEEDIEGFEEETEEDKIARQQRERLRMERRKEREREMRLDNMKVDDQHQGFDLSPC